MKYFFFSVIIVFTAGCFQKNSGTVPRAVNGILDLRDSPERKGWDFERDGELSLDGEWEFYWEKFISPSSVGGEKIQPSLIQVPLQWQKQKILLNGQQFQIPRFGYASCRLKIIFPDKADKLTLYSSGVSSSYEIYADGELILRSGKKGISLEETEPFSRRKILPLKTEGKRETDIVIHVSNYHDFSMFGIWDRMVLDRPESAVRSYIFKSWETFILFSSLAVMGIYHIVLYLNRKHDRSPLYFGLFCILMAIREMSIYDKVIIDLFPSIPYWLVHKFEFIPFYAGGILFTMFIQSLFPEEFPSFAFKLILTAGAVPIFLLIFFPMHIYTYTRGFYQILSLFSLMVFIYASSRAIYRRKEGAGLFVAAVSVFLMTMVHDVLKARGVVHTPAMNGFGLLTFIFFQSIALSKRFASSFSESERLGGELKNFALQLEQKIRDRTEDLEDAKKEVMALNEIAKSVNANLNIQNMTDSVMKYVRNQFDIDFICVFAVEKNENRLKALYFPDIPDDSAGKRESLFLEESLSLENTDHMHGYVYSTKKPLYIGKLSESQNRLENNIVECYSLKSYLCIPLLLMDEVIGFIGFANCGKTMELSSSDIASLEKTADQITGAVYNFGLLDAVTSARAETEKLNELVKNINSVSSLTDIMSFVMYYLETEYKYKDFWLVLPDKIRNIFYTFSFVSAERSEQRDLFFNSWTAPLNQSAGKIFDAYVNQEFIFEILSEDNEKMSQNERIILEVSGWEYFFCLPLLIYGETVGILCVNRPVSPDLISADEKSRMQKFSDQIAGAVSNSLLIRNMEKAKAEMESLNELTRNINSVSSLTDIMSFVMYYLETDYQYKDFWLILADREKKKFKSFSFVSPELPSEKLEYFKTWSVPLGKKAGKIFEAFSEQKTVFFASDEISETLLDSDLDILRKTAWKYLYYIPLIIYGETIGILSVNKPVPPDSISEEEKDRLQKISDQIAGAVQNAELLKESEEAQKQVEFLNEFSKVINSAKDLDTVFQQAVKELTEKLGTDIYILQLADRKKNELFTRCYSASKEGNTSEIHYLWQIPLLPESGSVFKTYTSKNTFYFKNNDRIPDEKLSVFDRKWKNDLKLNATFQIPLSVRNEVIGIMHINRYGGLQELQKEEIRFAELLCEQLAIAVNNSFLYEQTEKEREKSEKLLLNILPEDVAEELKEKGATEPVLYDSVSVLFTDFKGFTKIAENMSPQELIKELDGCFSQFDRITERFGLEKLKTIGDSYMCAGGIPKKKNSSVPGAKSAVDAVLAALEIQAFMNQMKEIKMMLGVPYWELRLGIHSGPLVAGVIGEKKFAYDVWGDTVNTASRMESSGTPGKINISGSTYELVKDFFDCEYRGRVNAKNKGEVDMHYVLSIREGYRKTISSNVPNEEFWKKYEGI